MSKTSMKLKLIFSLVLLTSFVGRSQDYGTKIDGIAAQVGNNIILISDIEAQKLQAIQAGVKADKALECDILEQLMYQELLLNQAILDSIVVTDQQVDSEMEQRIRVIEEQIGGRDKMEAFYGKSVSQIKAEFRNVIRDRLLAQEMERTITDGLTITPKEAKEFYESLPTDSLPYINSQLSFQQIVVYPKIGEDDKKRAFETLKSIHAEAISGKNFAALARKYSMDPGSAAKGGEIEARRGMMVAPFEATVFSLKEGEISNLFETEYGYHIIKLINRKGDNYNCAHILIAPEFVDAELESAAMRMDSCYNELKAGTITWEDAVLKYSNEESTKFNNGIITNPISGEQTWDMEDLSQVDQQIFLLTDQMKKGDISTPSLYVNPFERKEGVRIVRLMERTTPHRANLNDDYALISRAAESTKKQKIIDTWTKSKLKNAYIKISDNYKDCTFKNEWIPKI